MASGGKKKQKSKGKTVNLNEFLAGDTPGTTYVPKARTWADEMDNETSNGKFNDPYDFGLAPRAPVSRVQLPTAPRAARGADIDPDRLPSRPPYTAYVGNLPIDCTEEDIEAFFRGLEIVNIRIPEGRSKKFGYAEFKDRQGLLEALALNDQKIRNSTIRVDLAEGSDNERSNRRGYDRDDDGEDRTTGDWRRKDPDSGSSSFSSSRSFGDRDGGSRYGDRGGFGERSSFGDRDRGFGDRDRGFGDRDRGFGDRDRDRGYGQNRYGDKGGFSDRDRGYGSFGSRDRDDGRRSFGSGFSSGGSGGGGRYGDSGGGGRYGDSGGGGRYGDRYGGRDDRYGSRDRFDRYERRDDDRSHDDTSRERPRLNLAPRTLASEDGQPHGTDSSAEGERPRLKLAPRTKPVEDAAQSDRSSSIFGSAKPVDTAAKEREIEERLLRQHDFDAQKVEQEKETRYRLNSTTSDRGRHSSQSDDGAPRERRERKSSSSSGKGIRTVAPPPGVGSARIRRDSTLSEPEDVFDDEKSSAKPSPKKDDAPMVPAPVPKENIWAKRMEHKSGDQKTSADSERAPLERNQEPRKEGAPLSPQPNQPPKANAWSKARPVLDFTPGFFRAEPPKENAWAKRSVRNSSEDEKEHDSFSGRHWASNRKADNAGADDDQGGRPKGKHERPLPKSIDEMPKFEEKTERDWSDANKYSTLMADGEDAVDQ